MLLLGVIWMGMIFDKMEYRLTLFLNLCNFLFRLCLTNQLK
ncbi:hypothetical protein Xenpb_00015 [Xenorhabdus sp. PB62.4]|nr:hypothetical protein [Xenorhabdus sp. PB62.4]